MSAESSNEIRLTFSVLGRTTVLEVKRFGDEIGYVTINIFGPHANISQTMTAIEAEKLHEALGRLFAPKSKTGR